jgi:deferrochelatase/peroxidase EfeB
MRWLYQDVAKFNKFLRESAARLWPQLPAEEGQELLAAKLMGRWRNGAPMTEGGGCPLHRLGLLRRRAPESQEATVPEPRMVHGDLDNDFRYASTDAEGFGCPVTSHVRRTNPRDALLPPRRRFGRPPSHELSLEVNRRHRILRRGLNYTDVREGHAPRRGLLFLALNANLARQFEFIERSWMRYDRPSGQFSAPDPLASEVAGQCVIPQRLDRKSVDLRRFVTFHGGAYFFFPSLKALRFLAALEPGATSSR